MKIQKFKVVKTGKIIKVKAIGRLQYEDVKTGETYDIGELEMIPEKHSLITGFHIGRFGIYFFVREFIKFGSWRFGLSFEMIKGKDKALDVEMFFACFGAGIRFIKLTK